MLRSRYVRPRCFTASPHLGVGPSLVEEEEEQADVTCQHTGAHLYSSSPLLARVEPICLLADSRGIFKPPLPILLLAHLAAYLLKIENISAGFVAPIHPQPVT